MRGGASPRSVKEFSVLKVSGFWLKAQLGGGKLKVPPLGASAFPEGRETVKLHACRRGGEGREGQQRPCGRRTPQHEEIAT
jgi:hypothetical protein